MKLLTSQKNQVYSTIEDMGLNPGMFVFDNPTTYDDSTYLRLNDSEYYFQFTKGRSGDHFAIYSPGRETFEESQAPGNWNLQLGYVRRWLSYINRELEAPDKWELLRKELENMDFGDIKYENTKFTYKEYELLETKISELKTKIDKQDLLENQIKQINSKLDHLLHLAKDMNKTDWKNLFMGSIVSLFMQLSIDTTTGQKIAALIKSLFINFLPSGNITI